MSTSGRNCTSSEICPVPSQVAQRRLPVLYEKSPIFSPAAFAESVRAYARRISSSAPQYVATVERTLMPMGVASMRFARRMPSASIAVTCSGSVWPVAAAVSAGISVSSTSVVLPEPDTPVTAMSRPLGISIAKGFTVWSPLDSRWMRPRSNICSAGVFGRAATRAASER